MAIETTITVIVGVVLVVVLGVWWWLDSKAVCRVRIKELVKGRKIIKDYKAMPYTDDSKVPWWKLMGEKQKDRRLIPLPPEEAIEIDKKGKKCVEAYRFEDGTIVYSKDDWDVQQHPKWIDAPLPQNIQEQVDAEKDKYKRLQIMKEYYKEQRELYLKEHKIITPTEPLTTKQRALYLMNIKKAESRKGWDWKSQLIPIASIAAITLVLVCLMVFWGEIAAPALKAGDQVVQMQKTNLEMLQIIKDIKTNQQTIGNGGSISPISGNNVPN